MVFCGSHYNCYYSVAISCIMSLSLILCYLHIVWWISATVYPFNSAVLAPLIFSSAISTARAILWSLT